VEKGKDMTSLMVGYDMILSIGQNEVNSQFERLARSGYIEKEIASNGIISGGPFGGGDPKLGSYLRGGVTPPKVAFGTKNSVEEVEFSFTFVARELTSHDDATWSPADLEGAFDARRGATDTDALLLRLEDLATHDPKTGQKTVLPKQAVYYWIRRKAIQVGTTKSIRYAIVPALYYAASGRDGLLSLEGLELKFTVQLQKIPATAEDFAEGVKSGRVPPEVLKAITDHRFNENIFSIEQLFLNFDTVDFTQWDLRDPAKGLGATISAISVRDDGTYAVQTGIDLGGLIQGDPEFSTELSNNLQYVFGTQDKNPAGRTPYILGVSVSQPNPGPAVTANLVPAWIGYSTNPNPTSQGLSTVNYEVLGGADVEKRLPRNPDHTIRHLATPLLTSNDYSGALLFSREVLFDALVLAPTQAALRTGAPWTQDGMLFSSPTHQTTHRDHERDVTDTVVAGKWGYEADVYQEDKHTYTIRIGCGSSGTSRSRSDRAASCYLTGHRTREPITSCYPLRTACTPSKSGLRLRTSDRIRRFKPFRRVQDGLLPASMLATRYVISST
jgi:hypothetical protein